MKKIVLFLGSVLLLASCDVKDPIYNTPHPNHGIVMGLTEWSQRGEGVEVPAEYLVEVSGTTNTANATATATATTTASPAVYPTKPSANKSSSSAHVPTLPRPCCSPSTVDVAKIPELSW